MISCLGNLPDVTKAITKNLQNVESVLLLIGKRKDECCGSVYYNLFNELGAKLPKPDLSTIAAEIHAVTDVIQQGWVLAAHDISDGGAAVALAEMSFKNSVGFEINLPGELSNSKQLFSETGGFILQIAKEKLSACQHIFSNYQIDTFVLGHIIHQPCLKMQQCIDVSILEAKKAWENGLREKLL